MSGEYGVEVNGVGFVKENFSLLARIFLGKKIFFEPNLGQYGFFGAKKFHGNTSFRNQTFGKDVIFLTTRNI